MSRVLARRVESGASPAASEVLAARSAPPEPLASSLTALPLSAPVDRRGVAWGAVASIALHVAVLAVMAQLLMPGYGGIVHQIEAWLIEEEPAPPPEIDPLVSMADVSDEQRDSALAAQAMAVAPVLADVPELLDVETPTTESLELADLRVPLPEPLEALELDQMVVQRGALGDEILSVEGAVDRITHEIALNLEIGPVLVVWLMDASISLVDERAAVAQRLERVYGELDELGLGGSGALRSAVLAYGRSVDEMVAPGTDGAAILDGILQVPTDESGIENVFSAVTAAVERYKPLRTHEKRKIMVVIWTDESGDDVMRLESTLKLCQRLGVSVYCVGPSSSFGRAEGTQAYRHPDDGQVYQLPVTRGPDTLRPERLMLPYWFSGPQYEMLRAGVGPYALTRLAIETGGIYFMSEPAADRSPFRLDVMRRYLPDYRSPQEYEQALRASRLRTAVLQAVDTTHQRQLKSTPRLTFAPTADNYQQQLQEAQQTAAYNLLTIERALTFFGPKGLEAEFAKESEPRWRAWYDLTYGRLLAMRVRCNEYNWACAVMKGKGADFVNRQSNRWVFAPAVELNFGTAAERDAKEARRLLERCVTDHPGTPWALLAQRELEYPFGFEVTESYEAPPPNTVAGNNPNIPPTGRRVEQPRRIERPQVNLPKL